MTAGHGAAGPSGDGAVTRAELALASRNHATPLEALALDHTPVGLHYTMSHFDIPLHDGGAWQLRVDGHVRTPLRLDLAALRTMPRRSVPVTLECAGNGRALVQPHVVGQPWLDGAVGTAVWTGTPLAGVLRAAGLLRGAVDVVAVGADHGSERGEEQDYARGLPVADALGEEVLLAWQVGGAPLPPQHGAPLRLVVPGWYAMASVKWLRRLRVLAEPFDGYYSARAYRLRRSRSEPGEPVTRVRPRALLVPPGFPDFLTRTRVVDAGEHLLTGRAWCGTAPLTGVQVSADDGASWSPADLRPPVGRFAWAGFSWRWRTGPPGRRVLRARATAADGSTQPLAPPWNLHGLANNAAQRLAVTVR